MIHDYMTTSYPAHNKDKCALRQGKLHPTCMLGFMSPGSNLAVPGSRIIDSAVELEVGPGNCGTELTLQPRLDRTLHAFGMCGGPSLEGCRGN